MCACVQKHASLQTEFDALNHMLTHQPPSAWAKREKKYHDDKKAWDSQAAEMRSKTKRLQDEVQTLKDSNRAVVLQEQVTVRANTRCSATRVSARGRSAPRTRAACVQELEGQLKAARAEMASVRAAADKAEERGKALDEELAKLSRGHDEAVQEAVGARMAMRKSEEQLASKMAEAAAEANKAAEASRLLETLKRQFNESSLKGACARVRQCSWPCTR